MESQTAPAPGHDSKPKLTLHPREVAEISDALEDLKFAGHWS